MREARGDWDIFYVDAPSLIYRAFFALPKTITSADGRPVNAVRGFMDMLTRLQVDHRPKEIVSVFDADWRPAFRVEAWKGYKSERPEDPEELPPQFDIAAEVLDAAGIARCESAGLEADDAIATLVAQKHPSVLSAVVSGDRDLLSLVRDPDVRLLYPERGVAKPVIFDEAAVKERYGVWPYQYMDFAIMRGDSSDGLPGIAGIGPVRAAALLEQYETLERVMANVDFLPPRQAEAFRSAKDYLDAMKVVVDLVRDAPIDKTEPHPPDEARLRELAERYNLGSSAGRLLQALTGQR
ncbi:MAG: 5'-3' exonuclease [Actinomycetota bacterium]|nr:5'-3' exonuclease [Actinomycetota bacterium]